MKKTPPLLFLATLILIFVFFQSCKEEENPVVPDPEPDIIIPATTKVISQTDFNSLFIGFSSDSTQLIFNPTVNTTYNPKPNDIIYIPTETGLLRKVISTAIVNNQLIINTTQGTLEEAIEKGKLVYNGRLSKSGIHKIEYYNGEVYTIDSLQKMNEDILDIPINTIIYDADNNLNTTNDQIRLTGNFKLTTDIILEIIIGFPFNLEYVKYGFETDNYFDLKLEAMISYNLEEEIQIAKATFSPINIQVGALPVIIIPEVLFKVGVEGFANAGITTSVDNIFHYETGVTWNKTANWQTYQTVNNEFSFEPPELTANAGAKAYIKPEISLAVYGVLAGYAFGKGYIELEADLFQTPWWKLYWGYNLGIGARAEIIGNTLFDYSKDDLIVYRQLLTEAATNVSLPTVTTASITNITTNTATGGGNVTSDGGAAVTARGVCWSTSQNPTTANSKTTDGTGTGSFTSSITGLSSSTTYYVRAYATNSAGTSYGNQVSFTSANNSLVLFFDGFESGDFQAGEWSVIGSINVSNQEPFEGQFCALGTAPYWLLSKDFSDQQFSTVGISLSIKIETYGITLPQSIIEINGEGGTIIWIAWGMHSNPKGIYAIDQTYTTLLGEFQLNRWYKIELIYYSTSNTYSVSLDDVIIATGLNPLAPCIPGLLNIHSSFNSSEVGKVWLDNIIIREH